MSHEPEFSFRKCQHVYATHVFVVTVYCTHNFFLVPVTSGTFTCHFDVFYYPFDKQRCSVLLQLSSVRMDNVTFMQEVAAIEYKGVEELPLFVIKNFQVVITYRGDNQTRYSVLSVSLTTLNM